MKNILTWFLLKNIMKALIKNDHELINEETTKVLQILSASLFQYFNISPVYFDIVTVELGQKKKYFRRWYGPDDSFLNSYKVAIDNYFKIENRKSLLFLTTGKNKKARHEYFTNFSNNKEIKIITDYEFFIIDEITLDESSQISAEDEINQKALWQENILDKIEVNFVSLSKVDFSVADSGYSSAIWIGFDKKIDFDIINSSSKRLLFETLLERFLWEYSLNTIASELQESTIRHATKSAIAAVMCRNMSHNIGSHPIPQFNEKIEDLKRVNNISFWLDIADKIIGYNKHLQERMEFVADISATTQSHIYIEYDFANICEQIRLGISGDMEIIMKGLIDSYVGTDVLQLAIDIPDENFPIDLRGDNMGLQAIHVIIENIIRNTYKHSNPILNGDEKQIRLSIKISELEINSAFVNDYYFVDIFDLHGDANPKRDFSTLEHINNLINQSILDKDTKGLRDEGWGLLEMKAAAAYLIGFPFEKIDEEFKDFINIDNIDYPYPITAGFYNKEGLTTDPNCKNLGYRFYLPKPKFCLIDEQISFQVSDELRKEGIEIGKISGGRHRFFVTENENQKFNNQRVAIADNFIVQMLNQKNIYLFKQKVWENYIEKKYGKETLNKKLFRATMNNDYTINEPLESIIFDTHGEHILNNEIISANFSRENLFTESGGTFFYYESYPSVSEILSEYETDLIKKNILYETACVKIAVFDERIQQAVEKNDKHQPQLKARDILEASGVFVPESQIINLKNLVSDKTKALKEKLEIELYKTALNVEYLIVHQTLIEILAGKTNKADLKNWIQQFEKSAKLIESNKVLVITSGRGRTSNLPDKTFYLNFTTLNSYVVTSRSKLNLVNVLKLLRKR